MLPNELESRKRQLKHELLNEREFEGEKKDVVETNRAKDDNAHFVKPNNNPYHQKSSKKKGEDVFTPFPYREVKNVGEGISFNTVQETVQDNKVR